MRITSKYRALLALAAGTAIVFAAASPAAADQRGEFTAGTVTIDGPALNDPIVVDLADEEPEDPCGLGDQGDAYIDVSTAAAGSDYTTHVDDAFFPKSFTQISGTWYQLDLSWHEDLGSSPAYDNDGFIETSTNPDTVDQHISLIGQVYELDPPEECEKTDLVCEFRVLLDVSGTYTGTVSPPSLAGTAVVSGSAVQSETGFVCEAPFDTVFSAGSITLSGVTIVF